ncbi:MAG: MMPL family transporter [Lentisphaeria bacterium]|nr:MMPL family transporter [Lentisphaeria bacterium]
MRFFSRFYTFAVLEIPRLTLLVMLGLFVVCLFQARHFFLDASTDSLMLESDPELRLYRKISRRYESLSLLAVTYTPAKGDIFDTHNLRVLKRLRDDIRLLPQVETAVSMLDVPLFQNPPVPISQVVDNIRTLEDPEVDMELAKRELLNSEAYREQLIGRDGKTAVVAAYLKPDSALAAMRRQRTDCQLAIDRGEDVEENKRAIAELTPELRALQKTYNARVHETITGLRAVIAEYAPYGNLRLGGETMVGDDMLTYIRDDLKVFGISVFLCVALMLKYFFGSKRWVMLAVICCVYSTVVMTGLLGTFEWPVTVISSNFISLLLVMNMSLVIHLVVQYRELAGKRPEAAVKELIRDTVSHKWTPCLFTTLTTIAGFSSLVLCDIKPVKDFGLMMSMALVVSMLTSFILFPSLLLLIKKEKASVSRDVGRPVTTIAAKWVETRGRWIILGTVAVIVFIVVGMSRITVENSFVNHFRKSSPIYDGMVFIDQQLGGTTPLDVVINLPEMDPGTPPANTTANAGGDTFDEFDEFDEFDDAADSAKYWYTPAKLAVVRQVHSILERQPETGKTWSFATLLRVTDTLNGGDPLDAFALAIMADKLPDYAKNILVDPFVSVDNNQFRLSARVYDSDPDLRRHAFLRRLRTQLREETGLPPESIQLTGTTVLYNSVLQSLFKSQILTLGVVFVILLLMFLILFRSLKLALIALFPNLVSSLTVLGALGVMRIPLDIMTITIASISIGIAVDDTIHYIHRFREEFRATGDYHNAMRRAHQGVGSAMYYTSVTIVIGFSLLAFSNFIPSVLFGLLTGGAMVAALFGALTLLPLLLVRLRPFGEEPASPRAGENNPARGKPSRP